MSVSFNKWITVPWRSKLNKEGILLQTEDENSMMKSECTSLI